MKNAILLPALLILAFATTACNIRTETTKPNPMADLFNKPMKIAPGTYDLIMTCGDKTKNEKLPKLLMTFDFMNDGTYLQKITNYDPECTADCKMVAEGGYAATESTFTFVQSKSSAADGSKLVVENRSAIFSVIVYSPGTQPNEKPILLLENSEADNACGGKMTWTMLQK